MSEQRAKTGSSSNSAMLLLLVRRVSGQTDEFYLANGLTIGRTVANTVVLGTMSPWTAPMPAWISAKTARPNCGASATTTGSRWVIRRCKR